MAKQLFKHTFLQCDVHLKDKWSSYSLSHLRTWWQERPSLPKDGGPMQDVTDAAVALVAVQLCLIDLLKTVGFTRDTCHGFLGHSAGEIAAGYFDECYDRNTALDIAFLRGRMRCGR